MIEKVLFSEEECDQIMNLEGGDWIETKNKNDRITSQNLAKIPERISSQRKVFIQDNSTISEKLKEFGIKSVKIFETLQNISFIIKYEKGGKFERHQDVGKGTEWRYKTLIVQLSNGNDYEGGDLSIWDKNNNEIKVGKQKGNAVLFDASSYHQLHPIISGTRYSLVMWLPYESFGISQTML